MDGDKIQRADLSRAENDDWTPLHAAASNGRLEDVQVIIDRGADLNRADKDGWTPLYTASLYGHLDVVQFLIGQGADLKTANEDGMTPLHAASLKGHLNVVQFLIRQGADLNRADRDGWTPLYAASFNGQLDIVKFLIGQGADLKNADKDGRTPLYMASFKGQLSVVQFLIGQQVDLNRAGIGGRTLLHAASLNGHLDVVEFLIGQGADINRAGNDGRTPIYAASFNGHLDVFLIGKKADLSRTGNDGSTLLEAASLKGHLDVVQFLIGKKTDLNRAGIGGRTPLQAASLNGHLDVVQFLIGQGADLNRVGRDGNTPLEVASIKGHVDVVQVLIGQKADLNRTGNDGSTPLEAASLKGHLDVVQFLIGQGADLNRAGIGGRTPLQAASFKGHLDVVQFLIGQGADLNTTGNCGRTPIQAASFNGHQDVVQFLTDREANLNRADIGWRHTPLHAQLIDKDPAVGSKQESGGVEKQVDSEANVHTSKLEQLNLDSASSEQVVEDVIHDSMGASDQQAGLIRIEKYGIEVQFHPSEIWGVEDIQAVPEVPAELADLLTEDQAIICVGLKASPSDAKFKYPVKVTMPHSAIFTSPDTASIGTYHRKTSSDSFSLIAAANGDPRCDVRERDLDLYISHFSEWWIVSFITKVFVGKRVICTPFVPEPSPMSTKHLLRLCIRDSNQGKAETQQEILFHKSVEVNVRFIVNTPAADQSKVFVQFILEQSAKMEIICPMNLSGDQVTPRAKGTQKPTDSPEVTDMHLLRISQELLPDHFSALHLTLGIKPSIAQGILTQKINDYPDTYMHLLQLWKTESHRTLRDLDQVLVESRAGGLRSKYK
eukprot:XP_011670400.1 PREDICTED: ankyrin repeat domain-containing protein 50-like [Strongylocentrotus purpuratus]